ncbi:MAG: right-handed parallel beta-helix repeat-containing protein, partial [Planctomycetes bacterium]|nr:right-handed parallel beta-helix repeat-containing protein [Planctomycetota bacterium]
GTDYTILADPNLPPGDWNGAVVLIWPGSCWTNATRRVVGYAPGKELRFDSTLEHKRKDTYHKRDPYRPKEGNPYILYGSLAGLDSPGEWYLDAEKKTVYLWAVGGGSPAGRAVEVKQRIHAFDLTDRAHIELHGLRIFAAGINMTKSQDCLVYHCHLRYPDHFREMNGRRVPTATNIVSGSNNEWRRCSIVYSASSALSIGGRDNKLINSIIHDAGYMGSVKSSLSLRRAVGAVVRRCTIFRGGRDLIGHGGAKRIRIEYNDIHHANLLNNDSGATYSWGTDGEGSVIAHNWVHDNMGSHTVGIYLDNFSRNYVVHHNVVWNNSSSGIRLNSDSLNNLICNNTLRGNREPFGVYTYAAYTPTQKGTRILNNLVIGRLRRTDPRMFVQGELAPEISHNGAYAIEKNGVPSEGSGAIDAGMVVAGVTDGYKGKAPDIGAYEFGASYWRPGADWSDDPNIPATELDLQYRPPRPISETGMITKGLQLWLDASDAATIEKDEQGRIGMWKDKSGRSHHAVAKKGGLLLVTNAINGKPVVRGDGTANMTIGTIRPGEGAFTVFIVSQGPSAAGPNWQRIMASYSGEGKDWIEPNWHITRPNAEKPTPYAAETFFKTSKAHTVLDRITIFGTAASAGQCLAGDIAEVILYDRFLSFDEVEVIEDYLSTKWGIAREE